MSCRLLALLFLLAPQAFGQNVAIVASDSYANEPVQKLQSAEEIDGEVVLVTQNGSTPTLAAMMEYDVILTWSNGGYANAVQMGDLMADLVDAGKTVIQFTFAFHTSNSLRLRGRWESDGYNVFAAANQTQGARRVLGEVVGDSPLFDGVNSFDGGAQSYRHATTLANNAILHAAYDNGQPLAAVHPEHDGKVIGLNFFPASSDVLSGGWESNTDGLKIILNAINFRSSGVHRHFCAANDQRLKCWGLNDAGQLGYGHLDIVGDRSADMGDSLPYVDLGENFLVRKFATRSASTCALSAAGHLKCWGLGDAGQLGQESTVSIGDQPEEMGDNLRPINLGTDFRVADFAMGNAHVCALSTDGVLKCFGSNRYGQLGQGDLANRGDESGEMGDNLPPIDLGSGRTAIKLAVGGNHTCVQTNDLRLRCFGQGYDGQLGNGRTTNIGDQAGEMGDNLAAVDLGDVASIEDLVAPKNSTCVRFADGRIKCFGSNNKGVIGAGTLIRLGDRADQFGDQLPFVDLGMQQRARDLRCSSSTCCALLVQGTAKCWGNNSYGQLGLGDTMTRGDQAGQMGDDLPPLVFGSLESVEEIMLSASATCTRTSDGWKCFGYNRGGVLGYGDAYSRGDTPESIPALLRPLELGF